jgi:uncharacterized membrane protein YqgA involved in biofilm formation
MFQAMGLFTLGLGAWMAVQMRDPFAVFVAWILGAAIGQTLQLDRRLQRATARTPSSAGELGVAVQALLLFSVGSMTVLGCMADGLRNDPSILLAKGSMDFVSSAFLAATLGRGVLWAAPGLLVLQGGLTLLFAALGAGLAPEVIQELTALGGLMLLALGLQLLEVRTFPLIQYLPALLLLPFLLEALSLAQQAWTP